MSDIPLTFEKSEIPIIWLDTSIIIKMTRWKKGRDLDLETASKMEYLYNNISKFVSEKKLICPLADQDEEIFGRRRQEILETMLPLTLGIRSKYSELIKENQIYQFMKAYVNDENEVVISSKDFFGINPLEQLKDAPEVKILADLGLPETDAEIRNRKYRQNVNLEEIRKKCESAGVTYKEQLNNELMADIEFLSIITGNLEPQSSPDAYFALNLMTKYINFWEQLKGEPGKLQAFFTSTHYMSIPLIDISSKLGAKLITGTEEIKPGHPMDVHHAASAIPYVNLFITDRNMKHIINGLDIDEYYHCKVCHASDQKEIEIFFSDL